jgi:hypothetical protein
MKKEKIKVSVDKDVLNELLKGVILGLKLQLIQKEMGDKINEKDKRRTD